MTTHAETQSELPILSTDATLRDTFAAQALAGLCTPQASVALGTATEIAAMAYRVADALISQRKAEVLAQATAEKAAKEAEKEAAAEAKAEAKEHKQSGAHQSA